MADDATRASAIRGRCGPSPTRLRLRLFDELLLTARPPPPSWPSGCGQSPANCSWHLRQLARYGYVDGGRRRHRPAAPLARRRAPGPLGYSDDEPELSRDEAAGVLVDREYDAMRSWQGARRAEPRQWREAGFVSSAAGWLTAEELTALRGELMALLQGYGDRMTDPATRPPGARPIRFMAWGVPARPITD